MTRVARLIAFYLPQYYPIPENDGWWGPGFTEWTHVAGARRLYRGHYQPHLPADLGFYDLRVPETRAAQAEMARAHGIEAFCYWHYWFGGGRRLLERPFLEVLRSGQPDLPFCLAWANDSWTGAWYGDRERVLVEQRYPGPVDDTAHFHALLEAFADDRYVQVDGRPLFLVFRPEQLPDPRRFTDLWRELALRAGLKGLHLVGVLHAGWDSWRPEDHGFDAAQVNTLQPAFGLPRRPWYRQSTHRPKVVSYRTAIRHAVPALSEQWTQYPGVMPNWDNTPRCGLDGYVFHNSTPELFRRHLRQAIGQVIEREPDRRVILVKSWNEWAEGNHLEPDQRYGRSYLKVVRDEVVVAER